MEIRKPLKSLLKKITLWIGTSFKNLKDYYSLNIKYILIFKSILKNHCTKLYLHKFVVALGAEFKEPNDSYSLHPIACYSTAGKKIMNKTMFLQG